jgi:uncharacterized membrane protein YgcG
VAAGQPVHVGRTHRQSREMQRWGGGGVRVQHQQPSAAASPRGSLAPGCTLPGDGAHQAEHKRRQGGMHAGDWLIAARVPMAGRELRRVHIIMRTRAVPQRWLLLRGQAVSRRRGGGRPPWRGCVTATWTARGRCALGCGSGCRCGRGSWSGSGNGRRSGGGSGSGSGHPSDGGSGSGSGAESDCRSVPCKHRRSQER